MNTQLHATPEMRQSRPLVQRLTPVTWFVLSLLLMFAGLAAMTAMRNVRRAAAEGAVVSLPPRVVQAAVVAAGTATPTPAQAVTPKPTVPSRSAKATAAFFATLDVRITAAVKQATTQAQATQAIATFTPAPPTPTIYPAGYKAPWADKMVQQADGTWMAPPDGGGDCCGTLYRKL